MASTRLPPAPGRIALAAAALLVAGPAAAQVPDQLRRKVAEVGVEERLGAAVPRDATFTEADGRPLRLADLGDRPVLLSFNYTSCPRLCGLQLAGLARALRDAGWDGAGFQVLTVSIDPAEQLPQLARYKAEHVHQVGERPGVAAAWHFAKGAQRDVDALAAAVGFRYRYDPETKEYAHQATLVVLTADGRVSSYLHGVGFEPAALQAAVARAAADRVATAAEQASVGGFLLTCMGYDPADPAPRALKLMRAGGTLAALFLVGFLGFNVVRDTRRRSRLRRDPPDA